ncbi:MAG TPA: glycine oxidase ThiO [Solirubrobacteraceae bacterium]|jgi:glycine oxidase
MPSEPKRADVVVVGAGIVGLSIAWRAARCGLAVTLLDRAEAGAATSHVAAGMLAPVAEAEFGEGGRRLLALGRAAAERWPGFAHELEAASGLPTGLLDVGTLLVAGDDDEAAELERQLDLRRSLGLAVEPLRPSQAREREPALAPALRMALEAPHDRSVDPRLVLAALREACVRAGVELREGCDVRALEVTDEACRGVRLHDDDGVLEAERVVLAAGPWSGEIEGVPAAARVPVRPVKGQIVRLRDPAGPGLLSRVLRFGGGYVVPRADGRYVLGATVEERGFETAPTAGGIYELLREAREIVPGITELEIEEISVGLRPGTPDNAPAIGQSAVEGLVWATGHYRNGILLAPLTADLVVGLLDGTGGAGDEELLRAADPARFATATTNAATLALEGAR